MSEAYEGLAKLYESMGQKAKAEEERAKDPKNKPAEPVAEQIAEVPPEAAQAPTPKTETEIESASAAALQDAPAVATGAEPTPVTPVIPSETPKTAESTESAGTAQPTPVDKQAEPVKKVETASAEPSQKASEPVVSSSSSEAPAKEEVAVTDPFEKGKMLFDEGKFKEAAPLWREVLKKNPGHAGAYFYAGLTRYELGEMEKAEYNLKKGLEYKERGVDAHYYLSLVYRKMGKTDQERKSLAAFLKKSSPEASLRGVAEARFAEMNATKPDSLQAENAKTAEVVPAAVSTEASAVSTANSATAAKAGTPATSGPKVTSGIIAQAIEFFRARDYESALLAYKQALDSGISEEERGFVTLQMGNVYREMRDFHSAVVRYREVVDRYPETRWAAEAERAHADAVWLENHGKALPNRTR